jgi:polysaccharide biosynthesis/export protein
MIREAKFVGSVLDFMKNRISSGLLVLGVLVMLAGCSTGTPGYLAGGTGIEEGSSTATSVLDDRRASEVETLNDKLMSQAQLNVDPGDYILGAGDLLQVDVFEAQELCSKARISSRGYITLPLLGQVKVDGMTAREAETYIESAYREKYIKNPHVGIFVEEHYSQRVTLVGQFKSPGTYDYVSKQRLLDVLALGGGLTDKASRTVQVRRRGATPKAGGTPAEGVFYVDLERLIDDGATELNIEINGGDVIYVAESGEYFVDGAVRRPGSYAIKQKMTLQEAVVAAGGFAPYAQKDEILVIRNKGGQRSMQTIDISKPENWSIPVEDEDVIVAKSSALGKLWHGFRFSFFGLGFSDPER